MKKIGLKVAAFALLVALAVGVLTSCKGEDKDYLFLRDRYVLSSITAGDERFTNTEQADWATEKRGAFEKAIDEFRESFGTVYVRMWWRLTKIGGNDTTGHAYYVKMDISETDGTYSITPIMTSSGDAGDVAFYNCLKQTQSIHVIEVTDGRNKLILEFRGGNKNYTLIYEGLLDGESFNEESEAMRLKLPEELGSQPNLTYSSYKLNRFYVKPPMPGIPDMELDPNSLSPADQAAYESVLTMYGRTLELNDNSVKFASTSIFASYNPAAYTKSGNNVTFTNSQLAAIASGTIGTDKFSLNIVGFVFEYVKNS